MQVKWKDNIESSPDILKGKPRIKGTRIPVSIILGYLASGYNNNEIINEFDHEIKPEHIAACLDYARDLSDFGVAI